MVLLFRAAGVADGVFGRIGDAGFFEGVAFNFAQLQRLLRDGPGLDVMVRTSVLMGLGVATVTTLAALLAAYAMTHFRLRGARLWFGLTLLTLYFPIEARMLPTFDVANGLGLVNTLAGLVLPILPLAVACFFLRQHLLTLPPELAEAARLDGAGPLRFLWDFVLPLSAVPLAAVFVVTFIIGWNQYLWPLIISLDNSLFPLMRGLNLAGSGSGPSLLIGALSMGPPLVLMLAFLALMARNRP